MDIQNAVLLLAIAAAFVLVLVWFCVWLVGLIINRNDVVTGIETHDRSQDTRVGVLGE